jgi:hypothetical protein
MTSGTTFYLQGAAHEWVLRMFVNYNLTDGITGAPIVTTIRLKEGDLVGDERSIKVSSLSAPDEYDLLLDFAHTLTLTKAFEEQNFVIPTRKKESGNYHAAVQELCLNLDGHLEQHYLDEGSFLLYSAKEAMFFSPDLMTLIAKYLPHLRVFQIANTSTARQYLLVGAETIIGFITQNLKAIEQSRKVLLPNSTNQKESTVTTESTSEQNENGNGTTYNGCSFTKGDTFKGTQQQKVIGDHNVVTQTNGIDTEGLITILSEIQTILTRSDTRHGSALTEIEAAIQSKGQESFFTKTLKALQTIRDIANASVDLQTLATQGIAQIQPFLN